MYILRKNVDTKKVDHFANVAITRKNTDYHWLCALSYLENDNVSKVRPEQFYLKKKRIKKDDRRTMGNLRFLNEILVMDVKITIIKLYVPHRQTLLVIPMCLFYLYEFDCSIFEVFKAIILVLIIYLPAFSVKFGNS